VSSLVGGDQALSIFGVSEPGIDAELILGSIAPVRTYDQ
jgi:hypothetical protein